MTSSPVVRAVTVATDPDRAFAIFTDRIADWWPLAIHTPTKGLAANLAFVDGALVETLPNGETSTWGTVTDWDPPRRLALRWYPSGGPQTSVSVEFEASGDQTWVVLCHDGWEAYGDLAAEHRDSYDGEYAWGWVLELYSSAARGDGSASGRDGVGQHSRSAILRRAYEDVAEALQDGTFGEPPAGEWNARQVAGHVTTNAEMMCQVVDDVIAARPARLHGPDDHAAGAIGRYDDVEINDIARDLRRRSARLIARYAGLSDSELATPVSTYIEHRGQPVVDGDLTLGDLFQAEITYHLPAHAGQIGDLRLKEDQRLKESAAVG
jgi:uncharacterized protein YndB with AHSA1/START domain